MKKPKTLETKLRAALRLIWSRSAERRAVIKAALNENKDFTCVICGRPWPVWMGEVDHKVPVGPLPSWRDTVGFIDRLFFSEQRVVCKYCHKEKTKEDRKAMRVK